MAKLAVPAIEPSTARLISTFSDTNKSPATRSAKACRSPWHGYQDSWYPELTALILSLSCLIATSIILKSYDGKPNPKMSWGLTLNAIISILATTSKVSLLFTVSNSIGQLKWVWYLGCDSRPLIDAGIYDDASRGPLGSMILLCTRTRKSIASVGAMLTLLAVAYDPFVQQIVSFEAVLQLEPNHNATVVTNRAQSFQIGGRDLYTSNTVRRAVNAAYWRSDFT